MTSIILKHFYFLCHGTASLQVGTVQYVQFTKLFIMSGNKVVLLIWILFQVVQLPCSKRHVPQKFPVALVNGIIGCAAIFRITFPSVKENSWNQLA